MDDVTSDDSNIILKSISNIQGVAALKPTKPLEFTKGLNVVYGANGCGKSSYVKVLKKAENPKDDINIFSNIFEKINIPAKATLTFSCDGEDTTSNWSLKNDKIIRSEYMTQNSTKVFRSNQQKQFTNQNYYIFLLS